jgi:hypothetical protein
MKYCIVLDLAKKMLQSWDIFFLFLIKFAKNLSGQILFFFSQKPMVFGMWVFDLAIMTHI